jgi:DNA-binding Xre family transcriptional regulator
MEIKPHLANIIFAITEELIEKNMTLNELSKLSGLSNQYLFKLMDYELEDITIKTISLIEIALNIELI